MELEAFVTQVKEHMESMSTKINDFRTKQMEKLVEIEKTGTVSQKLQEELSAMGVRLDEMETQKKGLLERLDEMDLKSKRHNNGDDGRPEGQPYETMGQQLLSVIGAEKKGQATDPMLLQVKAPSGLSETVNADGGWLVQTDFSTDFMKRSYEIGQLLSRINMIPISTNANGIRIPGIDETSRVEGSRYGGIRTYWEKEADTMASSKPKFRMIQLFLKKLASVVYLTDELMQDAAALEAFVRSIVPEEMNYTLEEASIRGTGVGEPLGFMNSGAIVSVAAEDEQDSASIIAENIINMWARMWSRSRQNSVWLINQDCEPDLMKMYIAVGTGGIPVYMPPGGLSASPYGTLFNRPVIPVEYCSTVGTVGDIILTDMSQMVGIEKGGIKVDSSIHVRFLQGENTLRFQYRADMQPSWNAPLTPARGTNTLSPHIVLATRP